MAKAAPRGDISRKQDQFSGHYTGTWQSEAGSHRGRLICDLTRLDARHYRAEFVAYWSVFHGSYAVVLNTKQVNEALRFQGEQDLGKLYGGVYHYAGTVKGGAFSVHVPGVVGSRDIYPAPLASPAATHIGERARC